MNSLDKIRSTRQGIKQDRPPVSLTLSLYGARLSGHSLVEHYSNPQKYSEGARAIVETFHPDILFTPFACAVEAKAFGGEIKYFPNAAPNIVKPRVLSADEMLSLPMPDLFNNPEINYFNESTYQMAHEFGKEIAIVACFLSPLELPMVAMGLDLWLETILFEKDKALAICEIMSDYFVKRANSYLEKGAPFIALPVEFCNPTVITKKVVHDIALPVMHKAFAQVKGPIIIHHGGNPINSIIKDLASLPNVEGFVIDHRDSLTEARNLIGKEKIILGNIEGPTLDKYSPEEIRKHCQSILLDRQEDSRFILQTSSADVSFNTPRENIFAVLKSARGG